MKKSFFQLIDQSIEKIEFLKNDNYSQKEIALEFKSKVNIKNQRENQAEVFLNFTIFDKEKFTEIPFFIDITMKGIFKWEEETPEDMVKSLLNTNAPAVLLSYIRSIISQITAYSGYSTLIIPLINFND